jgi:hypothetical protein
VSALDVVPSRRLLFEEARRVALAEEAARRPRHHARPDDADQALLTSRIGWSLVSLLVGLTGLQAWNGSKLVPGANLVSVALILISLWGGWRAWVGRDGLGVRGQALVMVALVVGMGFFAAAVWMTQPGYGTDGAAFDQYAASLAMHGLNPYTHSMAPALTQFHVPQSFHTYRLNGTEVDNLSYPSASFLFYMPALIFGLHTQAANVVDVAFWGLAGLMLWRMLPARSSWAAGLILSANVYLSFMIGGLTDALFVPFVLIAVYRWDRYGVHFEESVARWIGPIALGVACSVKQTPWFLAPFLLIGLWIEHRENGTDGARVVARYAATALGTFLLLNAPFIVANPAAWARGTFLPLVQPTIPDGQGLVDLTIFDHLGGGRLALYTGAGVACFALALLAFRYRYAALKRAWVPLIGVTFFLPTRSFGSYLFMLVPAAIVAGVTASSSPVGWRVRHGFQRWIGFGLVAGGVVTLGLTVAAVATPAPLSIRIVDTQSTGQLGTIDQATVQVTNHTGRAQSPHFTVQTQAHATTFWNPVDVAGHAVIPVVAAHSTSTFILRAPNTASMPALASPMFVAAFTTGPAAMSTSATYLVSRFSTSIVPDAVNNAVPVHQAVPLAVQLQDQYGNAVHRAGVVVVMGQVVYAAGGLLAGESSINGAGEGMSPVSAVTDAAGIAHFVVVGDEVQPQPVFYETWLADGNTVPHGYSNQVSIQYTDAP